MATLAGGGVSDPSPPPQLTSKKARANRKELEVKHCESVRHPGLSRPSPTLLLFVYQNNRIALRNISDRARIAMRLSERV